MYIFFSVIISIISFLIVFIVCISENDEKTLFSSSNKSSGYKPADLLTKTMSFLCFLSFLLCIIINSYSFSEKENLGIDKVINIEDRI